MDSLLVDESDLLMGSLLDPSLKSDVQLASNTNNTSDDHNHQLGIPSHGDADIDNVFEFQQFIDRQNSELSEHPDGKTAIAALKMIDLDGLDVDNQTTNEYEGEATGEAPGLANDTGSGSIVHVQYNPNEKVKRLGRPRKHLNGMPSPTPGESASDNLERATISKFRFDERPIEGPGSRGGDPLHHRKSKGKLTESSALKKRKQALLNFTRSEDSASLGLLTAEAEMGEQRVDENGSEEIKVDESAADSNDDVMEIEEVAVNGPDIKVEGFQEHQNGDQESKQSAKVGADKEEPDELTADEDKPDEVMADKETAQSFGESEAKGKIDIGDQTTVIDSPAVSMVKTEVEPTTKRPRAAKEKKTPAKKPKTDTKKSTKDTSKDTSKDSKVKKLTLSFKPRASRTTIIRERNRITRTLPGPLVPVHFDLYDDNLIGAETNASTSAENLALGFPVKPCAYLDDIIFLIGYLSKFNHIVGLGIMGPEDIEIGLGLVKTDPDVPTRVAPDMDQLFRRLIALVLNRKKPILLSMQRTAIQELRGQYIGLGLPEEWRDDEHIRVVTSLPCDPVKDRVDSTKPEVSSADNIEYQAPAEKMNPFLEPNFEEFGLLGIEDPLDRLIMLRCLAVWSLSASNQLKTYLTKVINGQDIPGERDTIYASRAVLKGFNQITDLKKELELKISKKNKNQLTPKGTPDPDSISRYIDPTSDPLAHPMALRYNEFLVGDCGFHIGRFYLVRMADGESGAISSIEKMKSVAKDAAGVRSSIPSSFKLYVEDVHQMLTESLAVLGPEFDEGGNEVERTSTSKPSHHWSVVASNADELRSFLTHIGSRLGLIDSDEPIISTGSLAYKPLRHMYQYLSLIQPLLEEFGNLEVTGVGEVRTSRKKKVNYSASKEADYEDEEEDPEEYAPGDRDDDDDYDEFDEGDGEDYAE